MELGDSGFRVKSSQPNSYCEICTDPKHPYELLSIDGCCHTCCKLCLSQYVSSEVEKNELLIKCPNPDCRNGKLEPATCPPILESGLFHRWCLALCESVVGNKFYCPFSDCSALMINEGVMKEAECPHCNRLFCAQCWVPWHVGFSCTEFNNLSKNNPNCKFFVEKMDEHCSKASMKESWPRNLVFLVGESSGTTLQEKMKTELHDSSCPVPSQPDSNCEICMDSKNPDELFSIKGCSHTYCKSCLSQYIFSKVEKNALLIKCPSPDCYNGKLEPDMCSTILEDGVFDRWCMALCESIVDSKFYCPFKDCSALMIDDKENVIEEAECPHCSRLFCAQCRVPWHAGLSCGEFQNLDKEERLQEDLMLMALAKKSQWQRCPRCKFFVEKRDGCMFVRCRCGFAFCYGCATEMKMDHYCSICKR